MLFFTTGWSGEWLPLAVVRVAWTIVALCLARFALGQFRTDRERSHEPQYVRVPPAVSAFLFGWAFLLFLAGVYLILFDAIAAAPQSVWFRAALGAGFTGTLAGCFWTLSYFKRTPYCDFHDAVVEEMNRRTEELTQD